MTHGEGRHNVGGVRAGMAGLGVLLLSLLAIVLLPGSAGAASLVDLADPLVGTGNSSTDPKEQPGGAFPGATLPFGMTGFSPDTWADRTNLRGGYAYEDAHIRDFTVTQFSGAGCAIYQDLPIVARAGGLTGPNINRSLWRPFHPQRYSHGQETATPGFYAVTLSPGTRKAVRASLTATKRSAVGRFRFSQAKSGTLTFDAGGSRMGNHDARVKVNRKRREITGTSVSGHFCFEPSSRYRLFYVVRFNRPIDRFGTWQGTRLQAGRKRASQKSSAGNARAGAYVTFNTSKRRAVTVRIGISFVDLKGARKNLDENRGLSFNKVKQLARQAWQRQLDQVKITGGEDTDRKNFATALYHSMIEPSVFNDRDGRYRGMDGKVRKLKGRNQYTDISGWDVYRSQTPLLAMLKPKVASDVAASLVADARQSGCLPRWKYANQQTNVMVGDPSDPMIASTWALGARDFDAGAALDAMVKGGSEPCHTTNGDYTQREALDDWLTRGYIPQERNIEETVHSQLLRSEPWGTASTALEYALADFTISRLAEGLGRNDVADTFLTRSGNWSNLVDPVDKLMKPRMTDGSFLPGYTPAGKDGWVEGSGAQYNWFVPHDPAGLFDSMGGKAQASSRLDQFFAQLQGGQGSPFAYFGNEPTFFTPWIYNWLGQPARGQKVIRDVQSTLFKPTPGGLPGNDDGGAMSAWYVLSALGLYPAVPGTDILAVNGSLFPKAELKLAGGDLELIAPMAGREKPYVTSMTVKGSPHPANWLRFSDVASGGRIEWDLSDTPGSWGTAVASVPPSFAP